MMRIIAVVLISLLCMLYLPSCLANEVHNDYNAEVLDDNMKDTLNTIKRIDEKGVLYEMDYTADYYAPQIVELFQKAAAEVNTGCSAFSVYNTSEEFMLCRNYDYMHRDSNGEPTGLNVVIHFAPEGKLKSVCVCDAFWLNQNAYYAGALDDGITDLTNMILAPYMCVDGMNEAGLAASLLVVDHREEDQLTNQNTGKTRVTHSELLRYIIDNAHDISEAEEIARSYDMYSIGGTDLHMYLCDKNGNSAVFEWRKFGDDDEQELYVTYTNAVTNFFVGFDDGEDVYRQDGSLKELCTKIAPTFNGYKYGYGHGYHRFNGIIASLERYIEDDANAHGIRNSVMEESQALDVLKVASQNPGTENTSYTQYSALYNLEKLSVTFWMQRDYENGYTFGL